MSNRILTTHNLTIGYQISGKTIRNVASNICVSLQAGELVCLLGASLSDSFYNYSLFRR